MFMPNPVTTVYLVIGIVQTAAAVYCLTKAGAKEKKR
jgi:hypothetical protein